MDIQLLETIRKCPYPIFMLSSWVSFLTSRVLLSCLWLCCLEWPLPCLEIQYKMDRSEVWFKTQTCVITQSLSIIPLIQYSFSICTHIWHYAVLHKVFVAGTILRIFPSGNRNPQGYKHAQTGGKGLSQKMAHCYLSPVTPVIFFSLMIF